MTITLYRTSNDDLKVNKALTQVATFSNIKLLDDQNVNTPQFRMRLNNEYLSVNYAYIPEFSRYYYVTVEILNNSEMVLNMTVDRLMSFINPYKSVLMGYVERNSENFNKYIPDDQAVYTNDRDIRTTAITVNGLPKSIDNWKLVVLLNAGLCNTVEEEVTS